MTAPITPAQMRELALIWRCNHMERGAELLESAADQIERLTELIQMGSKQCVELIGSLHAAKSRNAALQGLLDTSHERSDRLMARIAVLREYFTIYASHHHACRAINYPTDECSCGLEGALEALRDDGRGAALSAATTQRGDKP